MIQFQSKSSGNFSKLHQLVESQLFTRFIISLIIINAVILGMETYHGIVKSYGALLKRVDHVILFIFVVELILKLVVYKRDFFKNPWIIFDCLVVGVAFIPDNEIFSILRVARVLRVLRLVSIFPQLKRVVEGLIHAIPGIGSIGTILMIIMYVFAVMATKLYGEQFPEWFGSLQASIFSLFQIMTLEGWPDIVRTVMKTQPSAWIFFIIYILVATFSVLNLFIAVIVDGMQKQHMAEEKEDHNTLARIEEELKNLTQKIDTLKNQPSLK